VCVCSVFIFKDTEPSPSVVQESSGVRQKGQKGDLLGTPPVVPDPEYLAAQACVC
jgi:hypothetical protein